MAQGDLIVFEEVALDLGNAYHSFSGHTYKIALITILPIATQATPRLGDFTEVSGTGYTAGGASLTLGWTEVGGVATLAITNTAPTASWDQNGAGPTNIKAGVIYNNSQANKYALAFVDFTADAGTTAVSLQDGGIEWDVTEASNRILTLTVN